MNALKRLWLILLAMWISSCALVSAFSCSKSNGRWRIQTHAFTVQQNRPQHSFIRNTLIYASVTDTESKSKSRDMDTLFSWAKSEGIDFDNSSLMSQSGDDFALVLSSDVNYSSEDDDDDDDELSLEVLQVPWHLVLSSERIREELHDELPDAIIAAEEFLAQKKVEEQLPQFYLFVKLWKEYRKQEQSLWHPWIASFPKSFDTAVCYDDVEMECLPPFAWALASVERHHLNMFREALKLIDKENTGDDELITWIFNCVFTRCWSHPDEIGGRGRCDIVPLGDMFNHNADQTIRVDYDDEDGGDGDGNVSFSLRHDQDHNLKAGDPLFLSYGLTTNPFRYMVIFGFVDEKQPELFCQILSQEPSDRLVDMGYDSSKMVFRTEDGAIANAVWDVMMFNLLQQVPEVQETFYQAHMKNEKATKQAIHDKFRLEAAMLLYKHVQGSLVEFQQLLEKSKEHSDEDHPRLPLIRRHLEFMIRTFSKVQQNVNATIQNETKKRQAQQQKETQ